MSTAISHVNDSTKLDETTVKHVSWAALQVSLSLQAGVEPAPAHARIIYSATTVHCLSDASSSSQACNVNDRFTQGPAGSVSAATATQLS